MENLLLGTPGVLKKGDLTQDLVTALSKGLGDDYDSGRLYE